MTNILVSGGAGFIGSNLVMELIKYSNNNITVVDNLSVGRLDNLKPVLNNPRLKIIKADIREKEKMDDATKNIDVVYHLAVQCLRLSFNDPNLVHEVNATGTLNLLNSCVKNKIKKFVYISSSEAYGSALSDDAMDESHPLNPTTIYGASKAAGELYTLGVHKSHSLPVVIVRPFNSYGPNSHFEGGYGEVIPKFTIRAFNDLPPMIHGDGNQTRDFTYIADTVNGIILAANSETVVGEAVNIAYGREVSINEIAKAVLKATGKEHLKSVYTEPRPADVRRHYANISKAKNKLGFNPKVKIEDGIKKYVEWVLSLNIDFKEAKKEEVEYNWRN